MNTITKEQAGQEPNYVLRYADQLHGPLGNTYGLILVSDWNAGLSRFCADQVCDSNRNPLIVFAAPAANTGCNYPLCKSEQEQDKIAGDIHRALYVAPSDLTAAQKSRASVVGCVADARG